jgi:hypothetical protein
MRYKLFLIGDYFFIMILCCEKKWKKVKAQHEIKGLINFSAVTRSAFELIFKNKAGSAE